MNNRLFRHKAWEKLEAAVRTAHLDTQDVPVWVGQALADPHHGDIAADRVRFQAGVECPVDMGLSRTSLPLSRYARFALTGKADNLGLVGACSGTGVQRSRETHGSV